MSEERNLVVLRERIEKLVNDGARINDRVAEKLSQVEIERRADLIANGIATLDRAKTDLRKVEKPDNQMFNLDGTPVPGGYSKQKLDEIKKAKDRIESLEGALDKAIGSADFKKLGELLGKGGTPKEGEKSE